MWVPQFINISTQMSNLWYPGQNQIMPTCLFHLHHMQHHHWLNIYVSAPIPLKKLADCILVLLWPTGQEHVAIADGVPEFLKKSIILQTFGVRSQHPCQDVENVVIPPYVSPEMVRSTLEHAPEDRRRDIWVFFRGKMEVHPKNVSGRFYSK